MQRRYYDAMAMVRRFGRPDLFVTFTANPKWAEIEALGGAEARPDIVARVFHLKLTALLKAIDGTPGIFGRCRGRVHTIEYQKRGLPHAHMLIFLETKLRSADDIDTIICAELPAEGTRLHGIVSRQLKHVCSVDRCLVDGNCQKGFPKPIRPATEVSEDGDVQYRRRTAVDQYVVPYSPVLCEMYDAHINVEAVLSVNAVKYIFKYITKGADRAYAGPSPVVNENEKSLV